MNDTLPIDWEAAKTFLQLLGKNGDSRLRAIFHKSSPAEVKRQGARKPALNPDAIKAVQLTGRGIYVVINDGGDDRVSITHCRAYFAEFDGCDEAEQWQRVLQSGLPEPSIVNATGGGSLHFYWVLSSPVTDVAQWQADMKRLIAHLGSDKNVNDPSRVMRLPGCWYMDGNQQPVAQVQIVHQSDAQYTREQIIGCLPELKTPKTSPTPQPLNIYANAERTERRALEQLNRIPPRIPGSNTRDDYLNLFWGLVAITGPERAAQLMEQHSPEWAAQDDLLTLANDANGSITEATFFEIAKCKWGITSPKQPEPESEPQDAVQADELLDDDDLSLADLLGLSERLAKGRRMFTLQALLPSDLAQAVEIISAPLPTDPLSAFLPLVTGYSGLLKLNTRIASAHNFSKPANLFGAAVLSTGLAKTSIKNNLLDDPATDIRREQSEAHKRAMTDWREKNKGKPKDEKTPAPTRLFPHVTDYTPASLYNQLHAHEQSGLGMLIIRDELSGLFERVSAETKGGSGDGEAQLLELFDGDGYTGLRVSSGARHFDRCHVSIYGNIQPDVLKSIINGNDSTGKFARFLFFRVPSRILELQDADPTEEELIAYEKAQQTLKDYAKKIYALPPHTYEFSQLARTRFHAWFKEHQKRSLLPGTPKVIQALLGKTSAHALRLAGILHILKRVAGEVSPEDRIAPETVDVAMAIVDQLIAETEAFHDQPTDTDGSSAIDLTRHVHNTSWLNQKPVTRQDCRDKGGRVVRRELKAPVYQRIVDELVRLGYGITSNQKQVNGKTTLAYQATREMPD